MNEETIIQRLAAAARADEPGEVDVTAGVLAGIAEADRPARPLALWAFAATAAAAAVVVITLADYVAAMRQDPIGDLIASMMRVSI